MARRSMGLQFAIHFRARHTDPTVSERSRCVSPALLSDDNRWVKRAAHRSVRWDVTVKEAPLPLVVYFPYAWAIWPTSLAGSAKWKRCRRMNDRHEGPY
jgi:hypothetical protein